ncbi:MAG: Ig domain-containing protein, partial [Planctomycetota bacterium]
MAIALPAATVAAQSTNPGTRIVEITGDPIDAPSQPDLVPATANGYAWRASGTGMSADFPENPTAAPFRVWAVGGQPVAFAPVALEQRDASGAVISSLTPTSASAAIAGNTVRYAGLWANVDDVFTPGPTRVKHDTIVKVAPALLGQAAWYGTQWQVTLPAGMSFYPAVTEARVIADAGLMVVDEHGTACYSFGRVTLLDAANQTIDGQLRIEPAGDGYRLSIEAPASFMRTAAYPVTIDPTITILMNTDEANAWPWGGSNPQGCVCNRYDASQIGQAGTITAVAVRAAWTNYPALSYPRVVILMGETTKTAATFSATYAQNYDAAAQVTCYDGAVAFNAHNNGEWFENIVLTTPFSYSGSNALTVEMRLYGPNAQGLTVYVHKGQNPLNVRVYQANTTIGASGTKDQGNCNSIRLEMTDTPSITSPAAGPMPDGYVGTGYNVDVDASGGQAPLAFDISAGSLPPGLSIASGTGIISGNPTTPGNYSFTVRVTDNAAKTDTRAYTIAVYAAVTINSPAAGALAAGVQNIAYGPVNISASGGKPLLVYSIVSGSLPAGLSINSNSGAISGTPTATGTSNFTVRASDANAVFADRAYSITVVDLPTILSPSAGALTEGYVGDAYTQNFTAAGGQPAYSWSISAGALPAGLSINSGTGAISGSPSASGNFNFTVRVQDQN